VLDDVWPVRGNGQLEVLPTATLVSWPIHIRLTVARPEAPAPDGKGSSIPADKTCFRLIRSAAHIPNVAAESEER